MISVKQQLLAVLILAMSAIPAISFSQEKNKSESNLTDTDIEIFGFQLGKTSIDDLKKITEVDDKCKVSRILCSLQEEHNQELELDSGSINTIWHGPKEIDNLKTFILKQEDKTLILTFYENALAGIVVAPDHYQYTFHKEIDNKLAKELMSSFDKKYNKVKSAQYSKKALPKDAIKTSYLYHRWEHKSGSFLIQLKEIRETVNNAGACYRSLSGLTGLIRAKMKNLCENKNEVSYALSYRHPELYREAYNYLFQKIKEEKKNSESKRKEKVSSY